VSEPVVITDTDEVQLGEGPEVTLQGRGYVPYPAAPPPAPRPGS
jgi:hypothetical protein